MISTTPIVLFVFCRPKHTQKTLEALRGNSLAEQSDLIVYSDAARHEYEMESVQSIRKLVGNVTGFRSVRVIKRKTNYGLARNIIEGVTEVCNRYGRVIVLEDDMITSPYFLKYMNDALEYYAKDNSVISINGYTPATQIQLPETFFLRRPDCWGWATWQRGWECFNSDGDYLLGELKNQNLIGLFDFDGVCHYSAMLEEQIQCKIDSWAIRWYASAFLENKLSLYPSQSLVCNIGLDGSGRHCDTTCFFDVDLKQSPVKVGNISVKDSSVGRIAIETFYCHGQSPKLIELKSVIRHCLPPAILRLVQNLRNKKRTYFKRLT